MVSPVAISRLSRLTFCCCAKRSLSEPSRNSLVLMRIAGPTLPNRRQEALEQALRAGDDLRGGLISLLVGHQMRRLLVEIDPRDRLLDRLHLAEHTLRRLGGETRRLGGAADLADQRAVGARQGPPRQQVLAR